MFEGMPTWDEVMARPYQERMRAFRDPKIRQALSAEAVEAPSPRSGREAIAGEERGGSSTGAGTWCRSS